MKQEEIIEGNELIAKFMGYEIPTQTHIKLKWIVYDGVFQSMKFNCSWDWLMLVVEKIESVKDKHHGCFGVHISSNNCSIQGTNFRSDKIANPPIYFYESYGDTKLEATYIACIKFINWYNKNKK